MEFDEMKLVWQGMGVRQDGIEALLRTEFRDRRVERTRSILGRGLAARALELAAWIAFTVWAASFWVGHRQELRWLVIGLLLHAYGIAGIWASATQLLLLGRIYLFDAPVLELQRRLAQLRRFRVWCTLALGLPCWCLWLLLPLALAYQGAGVDGFAAGSTWIWASMAAGLAGMALSAWLARRLAGRPLRSPLLRRIVDDMSGCNLRRASRELDELARFDRE